MGISELVRFDNLLKSCQILNIIFLKKTNGQTILYFTQGDYNKVAEGERRYKEFYNCGEGWNLILVEIKKM